MKKNFLVHTLSLTQKINTGTVSVILPKYLDSVNSSSMIYGVQRRLIPSLLQENHLGFVDFHLFNTLEIISACLSEWNGMEKVFINLSQSTNYDFLLTHFYKDATTTNIYVH